MNYAIILSGGIGLRLGAKIPKQYLNVNGKPVIEYTLEHVAKAKLVDKIIIVAAEQWRDLIDKILIRFTDKQFFYADPGVSRQDSILSGLRVCLQNGADDSSKVIIHDAVRPLVSASLIDGCIKNLDGNCAVLPVLPVCDTMYISRDGQYVSELLDRDTLFAGQAPEAFMLKQYYELNEQLSDYERNTIRGSSELAYRNHIPVKLVRGEGLNFKITTMEDLGRFQKIVEDELN